MKNVIKNITPIILGVCFLFCANLGLKAQDKNRLEIITQNLESGKVYEELDLSNLNLKIMPDLSKYAIKKLNLSHNKITSFNQSFLPIQLEKLDFSHNEIGREFCLVGKSNHLLNLIELNVSYNKIHSISLNYVIVKKLEVNNNKLEYLGIGSKYLDYLDISNNPDFNTVVQFNPATIKTIIRKNIASEDLLEYALLKRRSSDSFDLKYIKKIDNSKFHANF